MSKPISIIICLVFLFQGCSDSTTDGGQGEFERIEVAEINKWPNGFKAAYTPTLDAGMPAAYETENEWLIENGLFIDYEIVSASYDIRPERVNFMSEVLIPNGFGYFGHGHAHGNHDQFNYDEAYESFHQNFLSIESYGFKPVAYAYPYGAGLKQRTRKALEDAGFLSGRLNQADFEGYGPCIMPGEESEPPDWFALPALRMESYDFEQCEHCVNDPEEFFSYLDSCIDRGAWLISTYHAIGFDGETDDRPVGWGFYRRHHFYEEMLRIKELQEQGIVWLAQMSEATLYTRQRNNASFNLKSAGDNIWHLHLDDGLDREIYDMPLTLRFELQETLVQDTLKISHADWDMPEIIAINGTKLLIDLIPSEHYYTLEVIDR